MNRLFADKRNIWYLLGMLAGVAAICIGAGFLKVQYHDVTGLSEITFGADFYTEIYNASRRIYGVLGHINAFIEYVKKGFGYTFILAGVIDICAFGSKLNLAKAEEPIEAKREEPENASDDNKEKSESASDDNAEKSENASDERN